MYSGPRRVSRSNAFQLLGTRRFGSRAATRCVFIPVVGRKIGGGRRKGENEDSFSLPVLLIARETWTGGKEGGGGGQNLGNVGGFFIWCASDSGTLGIASVPMSLRCDPSKGIEKERGGASRGPPWRGELFSFYKLVQFFLKKRVNTAETGCVYADSRDPTRPPRWRRRRGMVFSSELQVRVDSAT